MIQQERDWAKTASMGEFQGKRHCWPIRTQRPVSYFPQNILIIPKPFGQIFCGLMRCVSRYIWHKTNTAFHKKYIIPTVKHGSDSVMVWSCFVASKPGWLAKIDGSMNSALYQKILKDNVHRQFVTSSSSAFGLCSKTMIPDTPASPPLNGSRKTQLRFYSGQVEIQT